jgi:kynurenine formamidase
VWEANQLNKLQISKLLSECRIVDLSKKVEPGGASGPGREKEIRKYDIKRFSYPPGEFMHVIFMESHISTHIEAPSHFVDAVYPDKKGKDVSEVPITSVFGEATFVNLKGVEKNFPITSAYLKKFDIEKDDIVIIGNSPHSGDDLPYLEGSAADHFEEREVKMIGVDDSVIVEDIKVLGRDLKKYKTHQLLTKDVTIVEGLAHLDQLRKERFLFFAIPAKMGGLEAFPIRAVAFECQ